MSDGHMKTNTSLKHPAKLPLHAWKGHRDTSALGSPVGEESLRCSPAVSYCTFPMVSRHSVLLPGPGNMAAAP